MYKHSELGSDEHRDREPQYSISPRPQPSFYEVPEADKWKKKDNNLKQLHRLRPVKQLQTTISEHRITWSFETRTEVPIFSRSIICSVMVPAIKHSKKASLTLKIHQNYTNKALGLVFDLSSCVFLFQKQILESHRFWRTNKYMTKSHNFDFQIYSKNINEIT